MIDIDKAKNSFKNYISMFENKDDKSFNYKVVHTYRVSENSKYIAKQLNLSKEEILLAELIGLLHDIGRFEELKIRNEFNNTKFNHAIYGSKILFEDEMINDFLEDDKYYEIIKKAIENHNKFMIEEGLDEKTLLFCKIIRDADKLDVLRAINEEKIESVFPNIINSKEDIENSLLSNKVYSAVLNKRNVKIIDRKTPLDYIVCNLSFIFDLNFNITYKTVIDKNYINNLLNKYTFYISETKEKMDNIRTILNGYLKLKINE